MVKKESQVTKVHRVFPEYKDLLVKLAHPDHEAQGETMVPRDPADLKDKLDHLVVLELKEHEESKDPR